MVDQPLDEIEDTPARERHADLDPPGRRQLAPLPRAQHGRDAAGHEEPGREVEEAVRERVRLEACDGVGGLAARARQQVVPLEDLVQHDPVDEAAEAESHDERGGSRRCCADAGYGLSLQSLRIPVTSPGKRRRWNWALSKRPTA